ncbi:hypothetical protein P3T39_000324 [Kitasatospora sp. GP82]|nr:hypothetical protein [Kitasatospora sp. GP82]
MRKLTFSRLTAVVAVPVCSLALAGFAWSASGAVAAHPVTGRVLADSQWGSAPASS